MPLIQFQARDTECYCASIISAYLCFGKKERLLDFLSINGNKFMVFCQILGICWLCVIFLLIPLKQHGDLGTFYSLLLRDRVVPEILQTTFFACTPVKTEGLWSPSPAHRWDLTNIMWCCYLTNCKSFNEERWGDISYIPMEIRYFVSRCNDIPVSLRIHLCGK